MVLEEVKQPVVKSGDIRLTPNNASFVDLPYLGDIKIVRMTPNQFELENWTRLFRIPDYMMRKIYASNAYRDTNVPEKEQEKFTKEQLLILHRWLNKESPFRPPPLIKINRTRPQITESTDIINILDSDLDCRPGGQNKRKRCSENNCDDEWDNNITTCYGHRYQPENVIVRKALAKMDILSDEDNTKLKELMANQEFMQILKAKVGKFLGKQTNGYAN